MKKTMGQRLPSPLLYLVVFIAIFVAVHVAFAASNEGTKNAERAIQSNQTTAAANAAMMAKSTGDSVKNSSTSTDSSNAMGMAMSGVMAAGEGVFAGLAFDSGDVPTGAMFTIMALQSLMQMANHAAASGQAQNTAAQTSGVNNPFKVGNYDSNDLEQKLKEQLGTNPDGTLKETKINPNTIGSLMAKLKNNQLPGIKYDSSKGTVSLDGGPAKKLSELNSSEAFVQAGIPKSTADRALAKVGALEKEVVNQVEKALKDKLAKGGYEEGEGMNGGSGLAVRSSAEGWKPPPAGRVPASFAKIGPAQIAGLKKNFKGDPIGVAADSIFLMVQRRYQTKERQNSFLDEGEVAPAMGN